MGGVEGGNISEEMLDSGVFFDLSLRGIGGVRRLLLYVFDDGVSYVVEVRLRLMVLLLLGSEENVVGLYLVERERL